MTDDTYSIRVDCKKLEDSGIQPSEQFLRRTRKKIELTKTLMDEFYPKLAKELGLIVPDPK